MARLHFKLRQNSVTKCFGSDAGAVRNEEYGAIGHVKNQFV